MATNGSTSAIERARTVLDNAYLFLRAPKTLSDKSSAAQIEAFVKQAADFSLEPYGVIDGSVSGEPAIHWDGFAYTFALLILRKRA